MVTSVPYRPASLLIKAVTTLDESRSRPPPGARALWQPSGKRPDYSRTSCAGSPLGIFASVNEKVDAGNDRTGERTRLESGFDAGVHPLLHERSRCTGRGTPADPYSVTEARVIFELAQSEACHVAELRGALRVDAGYLSRITARLEADGLVTRERSRRDGRRQVLSLTERGRVAFAELDARSATQIRGLLASIDDEGQHRLVAAMQTIQGVLQGTSTVRPRTVAVLLRPPAPGDYGWVVARHGALYAAEYGWDATFEALVARIVADYVDERDPARTSGWIAEVDGERAACVFCVAKDETTAQLRLLLVEPGARGLGIGARLVDQCLRFATGAGYRQIVLWTNDALVSARRIYEAAGFSLVEQTPHRSFGHDLVGQYWSRDL